MNKADWRLAVLAAGLFLPSATQAQILPRSAPIEGTVVSTREGETGILSPGERSRRIVARQDIKAGDILQTNARGALAIVFTDRTQVRLARNSSLRVKTINRGAPSALQLDRGRAWGRTPRRGSSLSVETPAATAGIRGTEWSVSVSEGRTILEVYEGEVEFFNEAGSLVIGSGEAASARPGEAPARIALVNRAGREQMLYFLRLEDGLDAFATEQIPGLDAVRQGDWDAALEAFSARSGNARSQAIAAYGQFLAETRLGRNPPLPGLDEDEPASFAVQAYLASYLGELDKAQTVAERGLALHPDARDIQEALARVALLRGNGELAERAVSAMLNADPQHAAALALRAEIFSNYAGKPYAALEMVDAALTIAPEDPRILAAASTIQLERGAGRKALASINQAIALDPNNPIYHAQRGAVLLGLGQVTQARPSLDRALELDPSLSILRTGLSEYHLLRGDKGLALEAGLAASADNPAYSAALLQLAEVNFQLGETEVAIQQLDAADRIDPASPFTPLARTAIALHRFDADGAIEGASEALNRFSARGGDYANLSENRATGSLVSQAFRFLGMEGWGRYYADRVFDSFTPSAYFDQALNQTPGPFVIRDADGSFDTSNAEDLDQLSSFLQGLALDPLGVANSERELAFDNGAFIEPEMMIAVFDENQRLRRTMAAEFDGIFNGPVPIGIGLTASFVDEQDARRRPDITFDARRQGGAAFEIEGFVGIEAGAFDHIVISGAYENAKDRAIGTGFTPLFQPFVEDRELLAEDTRFVFGLWSHEFGQRSRSTLAFGTGTIDELTETFRPEDPGQLSPPGLPDFSEFNAFDFTFASASYAHSIGFVDLRAGVEYADLNSDSVAFFFNQDAPSTRDPDVPRFLVETQELRFFADARARIGEKLLVQGHLAYLDLYADAQTQGQFVPEARSRIDFVNWRLAAAFEPRPGQWLRIAGERQTENLFPFTFAPINTLGLKGNVAPQLPNARSTSWIARWDAQWSRRFFTSVEYQDQRHGFVEYTIPDISVDIGGNPVDVNRLSVQANYWLGSNIGFSASYAYTDSAIRGVFSSGQTAVQTGFGCSTLGGFPDTGCVYEQGQTLPFVPQHIAQASIVWTLPDPLRLRGRLSATHIGGQIDDINIALPDANTVDLTVDWEPFGRRVVLGLAILNLLDAEYVSATAIEAPRRTIIGSVGFRF